MGEFKDTPSKRVIRTFWSKELISFLHSKLGYKFLYLGLPGAEILDLMSWLNFIERVIAFQCRDYPQPSSVNQSPKKVIELEEKLRELERMGSITTFSLYDGYVEEVLLRGRDTVGNKFTQDEVVTIYNLDFCNGITSPLNGRDDAGNPFRYYKSEAIRKLLEIQRDIASGSEKKFIMFLTIHESFWDEEAREFEQNIESQPIRGYIKRIRSLKNAEKNPRRLKVYIFDKLRSYFEHCNFSSYFFPAIRYQGSGAHPLIQFTIAGTYAQGVAGPPQVQDIKEFLYSRFLTVRNGNIATFELHSSMSKVLQEVDINTVDPKVIFEDSDYYNKFWKSNKVNTKDL